MNLTIDEAFIKSPRANFLPREVAQRARYDTAVPIGYGQTNSQPYTVAKMLEWLQVEPGQSILDIGSGSGWTTALLSNLTGDKGKVTAVEIVPGLVDFGNANCQRLGIENVTFHHASNQYGWPEDAPYDRILVSASTQNIPQELINQLANSGRMVIPVMSSIQVITKDEEGNLHTTDHPGFVFVPLMPPTSQRST